jgi:hypothetical protein
MLNKIVEPERKRLVATHFWNYRRRRKPDTALVGLDVPYIDDS